MRFLRLLRQRARSLFRGARVDAELQNELAFHLEQLTRENVASGMETGAARLAARRALGGQALLEDQCRDQRRIGWLTDAQKDLRYAWRMLWKSPGFTALAIVTLALGAGASIAVYTLGESLLLRSLPYPAPERLAQVFDVHVRRGFSESVGQENFRDWQASNTVFERMAFTEFSQMTLSGQGEPERITGQAVSEGFFEMLGVAPRLGRWFTPEEQTPGVDRVVLLSYAFWTRKLGARPEVVGATIVLSDRPYRVTGIMPADFRFHDATTEYWTPISYRNHGRQQHQYGAFARLKPGVSIQSAQRQMSEIARRLEAAFPDDSGWGVRVASMRGELLRQFGPELGMFSAAALLVMLIGCANVASLLLARGVGRGKEIAVRIAMGAGRRRVVRLLLTESLLLSGLGGLAGLAAAFWLLRLAIAVAPPWLQLGAIVSVSPGLVAFAISLTLFVGLLTGLWPALRGSRANLQNDLKESGGSLVASRKQQRALSGLVTVEIALAVVLLAFAGLLARSCLALLHADPGYRADHLLTFRMSPPSSRYRNAEARLQFWNTLLPKLAAVPGVVSVAAAGGIPLGGTYSGETVEVEGQPAPRTWADQTCRTSSVTPEYFRTMGIPLRAGRPFGELDSAGSEPVAIVNDALRRRLFPGANPIGARIRLGGGNWLRIVGVIGDIRYSDLAYSDPARPAAPEAYQPSDQDPWLGFVVLRSAVPEEGLIPAVRAAIREVDRGVPITQVRTMQRAIDLATALQRNMMTLVAGFAAVALGMATLGLAGVMAYAVSRRKREIGLRLAIGACGADVAREVLRDAARLVVAGCSIGVAGAFAGARLLESALYGVHPRDPAVLAAAPVILGAIALLACMVPARRAASIEPMAALRQE